MFKKHKKSLGVEIDDLIIRVLELSQEKGEIRVSSVSSSYLEKGLLEAGVVKNPMALSREIKKAFQKAKIQAGHNYNIYFAIPDERVFTHVFKFENGPGGIKRQVQREYKNIIPVPEEDGVYAFRAVENLLAGEDKNSLNVILTATRKKTVHSWQGVFERAGYPVTLFDIEPLALYRASSCKSEDGNVLLIDFSRELVQLSFFVKGVIRYNYSILSGLSVLLAQLAEANKKDEQEIFHIIKEGRRESLENDSGKIINDFLAKIGLEIKNVIDYYNDKIVTLPSEKYLDDSLLVLGGEIFNVSDIDQFKKDFSVFRVVKIKPDPEFSDLDINYLRSLGLALREFHHEWGKTDPFFLPGSQNDEREVRIYKKVSLPGFLKYLTLLSLFVIVFFFLISKTPVIKNPELSQNPNEDEVASVENSQEIELAELVPVEPKKFIRVNDIETLLNARSDKTTNSRVLLKLEPGSVYDYVEESDDWIKIKLQDGSFAWVSALYVSVFEE